MKLKRMIKMFLVTLCMCFATITGLAVENSENQDEALDAYEKISNTLGFRMDKLSDDYPDTFAGCYLDGNMLVIQLTDMDDQEVYLEACNYSPYVRFEMKGYSFEYLKSLEEMAYEMYEDFNIIKSYVDLQDNMVVLGMTEEDYMSYKAQRIESALPIKIIKEQMAESTAMIGGEGLYNNSSKGDMSVCFFGTYKNKRSLITCGHGNSVGDSISYNGTYVGNVTYQGLKTFLTMEDRVDYPTSYGDFSIVEISNNQISTSDKVLGENGKAVTATRIANVIEGMKLGYYGKTTKYGTGIVEHTLVKAKFNDPVDQTEYRVFGLLEVSGDLTAEGDSGGCVYYYSASTKVNRIAGCITGGNRNRLINYFTPVVYIEETGFDFD